MPQPQTETNLIQRLRSNAATARNIANRANDCANDYSCGHAVGGTRLADDCLEAADEIDRLRAEPARREETEKKAIDDAIELIEEQDDDPADPLLVKLHAILSAPSLPIQSRSALSTSTPSSAGGRG